MDRKLVETAETAPHDEAWRSRVAADLAAHAAELKRLWGGIDEQTLARHEAGLGTAEERARVEQAMRDHPALREAMNMAREFSAEGEHNAGVNRQSNKGEKPWADRGDRPETDPGKRR
jgi:putative protein kinase ArgK-like GTPase of G3E family